MRTILASGSQVSVITEIEVLGFAMDAPLTILLEDLFTKCHVSELSRPIVDQAILLRKTHKIKTPDAIIAVTALVHGLTVITRNGGDFGKIAALKTVDPHAV